MEMEPLFDLSAYESPDPEVAMDALTVALGEESAAAVVAAVGGLTLRIPTGTTGSQFAELVERLGTDLAALMVQRFGAEVVYIPQRAQEATGRRHKEIRAWYRELRGQGLRKPQAERKLALELKLSDRQIRRIVQGR